MWNPFNKDDGKFQQQVNAGVNPLEFVDHEKKVVDPLIWINRTPNGPDHFVILKTTENGKYIVDGMLRFRMPSGTVIIAEINDAIIVDIVQNYAMIKNYDRVTEEIKPKDPEERQYIVMYTSTNDLDEEEIHKWEAMQGRTQTYEWIRDNVEDLGIDPENSYVLVETVPYKDALTVTEFIKYLQNADMVDKEEFDIDEYIFE